MSHDEHPVYLPPAARIAPGALFLHVPIVFQYEAGLPVLSATRGNLLQAHPDFDAAWRTAATEDRDRGVFVAVRAKPRPIVVLAVGEVEEDEWHRDNIWVVPLYSEKERRRSGRNLFWLPSWEERGLSLGGYLDFFHAAAIPIKRLRNRTHTCDLRPAVRDAVFAAFSACVQGPGLPR
ncbi:MAG: hypothetical protein HY690_10570 [Chloroflexi bacterium]|nr:hypothetical protein [Chloroflexota bacterium]